MATTLQRTRMKIYELATRYSGEHRRLGFYREYLQTQHLDFAAIQELQLGRLKEVLQHAQHNCSFYRSRFNACGFNASHFADVEQMVCIPPLLKSDIQQHVDAMLASNCARTDLIENFTGGSTGQPLRLFFDRTRHESRSAGTMRHDAWAGRRFGDRVAFIWGAPADAPPSSLKSRLRRWIEGEQLWVNSGCIRADGFSHFNEQLKTFRPKVIIAYANSLFLFARFLRDNHLPTYAPKGIISSAEMLSDESRQVIQETFGCPVFNRYGCREVSVVASECEQHAGLHVMAEGLYLEIVDREGRPVPAGEVGDILVTDLLNYAMPLIRYQIGDRGSWAAGECPCGRGLPRLQSIAGRVTDFVVGSNNQLVSGVFLATYVVAKRPSLGRVQIIQSRFGHLHFRICPGIGFDLDSDRNYLFSEMRRHVGPLEMDWELVTEIPPEPSGKLLFCKSEIPPANLPMQIRDGAIAQQ